jgi:hypothetical protein
MDNPSKERWFQLCQLASVEQDPEKRLALFTEIDNLPEEGEAGIKYNGSGERRTGKKRAQSDHRRDRPISNSQDAPRL